MAAESVIAYDYEQYGCISTGTSQKKLSKAENFFFMFPM